MFSGGVQAVSRDAASAQMRSNQIVTLGAFSSAVAIVGCAFINIYKIVTKTNTLGVQVHNIEPIQDVSEANNLKRNVLLQAKGCTLIFPVLMNFANDNLYSGSFKLQFRTEKDLTRKFINV